LVDYETNDYYNGLVIPELVVITKYGDVKIVDPVFCYERTQKLAREVYGSSAPEDFTGDTKGSSDRVKGDVFAAGMIVLKMALSGYRKNVKKWSDFPLLDNNSGGKGEKRSFDVNGNFFFEGGLIFG
jgi:hypothetical protein